MSNILGGLLAVIFFAGFVCLMDKKVRAKVVMGWKRVKAKIGK